MHLPAQGQNDDDNNSNNNHNNNNNNHNKIKQNKKNPHSEKVSYIQKSFSYISGNGTFQPRA